MEDDEEDILTQSSQSQSPPPMAAQPVQPVTVAAAPPPQHILTLALPIQQPRGGGGGGGVMGLGVGGGGGGREDCWSDGATSVLIDAWGERYIELSRGNLKQKHWQEVADIVSSREDYLKPAKTDVQCKNRIDTLKKKYKAEKGKMMAGYGPSRWIFFSHLDRLVGVGVGSNSKINSGGVGVATAPSTPLLERAKVVPVGIPVGVPTGTRIPTAGFPRSHWGRPYHHHHQQQPQPQPQRNPGGAGSDSSGPDNDSSDSFPPPAFDRKRPRQERERNAGAVKTKARSGWGNSIRELTRAIVEFGDCYERAETSKLQQVVEMEKQRMGFAKELETQRMQFFMKTQMELIQLKHGRRVGSSRHHQHRNSNNNRRDRD